MADLISCSLLLVAPAATVLVIAVAKLVGLLICLRDTKATERPEIVRALAELFRPARRLGRGDDGSRGSESGKVTNRVDPP